MLDIFDFTLSSLYVPFRYHFVLSYNLYHISYMTKEKLKTSNSLQFEAHLWALISHQKNYESFRWSIKVNAIGGK